VQAESVTERSYLFTGLTAGLIYSFKVESRNSYDFSTYSEPITLLCAFKPEPPPIVLTTNSGDKVIVSWATPNSNGSPVTSYKILIREHNS